MVHVLRVIAAYMVTIAVAGALAAPSGIYEEPVPSTVVGASLGSPVALAIAAWLALRTRWRSIGPYVLIISLAVVTALLFTFGSAPPEGIYIWNPMIDTRLAPQFTEAGFERIRAGMTPDEVTSILGSPLLVSKQLLGSPLYDDAWEYSADGACTWGDFAWKGFVVLFRGSRVADKGSAWRFD